MLTFVDGSKLSKESRNCWTIIAPHEACYSHLSLSTCTHPLFSGKWPRTSRASSTSSTSALRHALEKVSHFNKAGTETKTHPMSTKPLLEIHVYKVLGYNNERLVVSFCLCLTASIFCGVCIGWPLLQSMYGSTPWKWPLMTWKCLVYAQHWSQAS